MTAPTKAFISLGDVLVCGRVHVCVSVRALFTLITAFMNFVHNWLHVYSNASFTYFSNANETLFYTDND